MDREQIVNFAKMIIEAHGEQADVAAKLRQLREKRRGNSEEVETWKHVRVVIAELETSHH